MYLCKLGQFSTYFIEYFYTLTFIQKKNIQFNVVNIDDNTKWSFTAKDYYRFLVIIPHNMVL